MPQQFKNPANPEIHERTTGPGDLGRHRRRRSTSSSPASAPAGRSPACRATSRTPKQGRSMSIAVEPAKSPVITQTLAGQPLKPAPHKIQGIGAGFVPEQPRPLAWSIASSRSPTRRRSRWRAGWRARKASCAASRAAPRSPSRCDSRALAGERGQDDRDDPARLGRALPVDGPLRRRLKAAALPPRRQKLPCDHACRRPAHADPLGLPRLPTPRHWTTLAREHRLGACGDSGRCAARHAVPVG